ncbi:hypothetical protein IT568_04100, partial [bacterium]|nr:hypothetical protein [bacterium]
MLTTEEQFEWLQLTDKIEEEADEKIAEAKASKRCPKCNWLDQEDVIECFRCGFNFETLPQHTEFFAKE